jgi:hypothetical protein
MPEPKDRWDKLSIFLHPLGGLLTAFSVAVVGLAGSQVIDEVRHTEVLAKFLHRKMGTLHPIDPTLKVLLDMLLAAPTWKMKTLGMQCLFEGMAVGIFDQIAKATTNPLLRDIIRRVQIDESRHAAFGILSMRQVVKESSREELDEMEDFAFQVLEAFNATRAGGDSPLFNRMLNGLSINAGQTVNGTSVALNLTGDAYPNNPVLTLSGGVWSNGKYVLDVRQSLVITTNAFSA